MSRQEETEKLLEIHRRRLHHLKVQEASFGAHTPPHISLEIEDIEVKIEKLEAELNEAETSEPPNPNWDNKDEDDEAIPETFKDINKLRLSILCYDYFPDFYEQYYRDSNNKNLVSALLKYAKKANRLDELYQLVTKIG